MTNRKILLLAIIGLLCWGLVFWKVYDGGGNMATQIKVTPSSSQVQAGQTFTIAVEVTPDAVEVAGLQMDIAFNAASMKVLSLVQGPFLGQQNFFNGGVIDNAAGTIKPIYGVVTTPGVGITAPGVFLVITAQALQPGASNLVLSNVIVGNKAGVSVPFALSVNQVVVLSVYDLNADGVVNSADLVVAAGQYGNPGSADFNTDGIVDILDLIILVQNFT